MAAHQDQSASSDAEAEQAGHERPSTSTTAPSPSPLPPRYSPLPTRADDDPPGLLQFDIVPRSDASSFQAGYQGLQQRGFDVWLRGDVLIKPSLSEQRYSQCTIDLLATESIDAGVAEGRPVVHQLYHSSSTLWTSPDLPGTSRSSSANTSSPPGVLPFEFSLPEHLPHCVHLPRVKIEYRLVATLHPSQQQPEQEPLTRSVLVHLTRYTPPNPVRELIPAALVGRFTDEPKQWTLASPTTIHITLAKTLYRRAEPIRIRIRIPPPDEALVDKNLRIRSVEAELIRIVKPRRSVADKGKRVSAGVNESTASATALHRNATADGWEPHTHLIYRGDADMDQAAAAPSSSSSSSAVPPPVSAPTTDQAHPAASTVLSYSGKSCRFSMHKPLVLRLMLVPPFSAPTLPHPSPDHDAPPSGLSPLSAGTSGGGGGCESVSQQTQLSSVQFRVRITVHLRGHSGSSSDTSSATDRHRLDAQRSVHVEQEVYVLPGLAGDVAPAVNGSAASASASASGSNAASPPSDDDDGEEEFDGYEDFREHEDDEIDALADQIPSLSVHSPTASTSASHHPRPPSFEESSRHATAEALLSMAVGGDPSFTTTRHQEAGEDLPPNVEDSRNDLQIFPGRDGHGDGDDIDDDELPPPPPISPARSDHHDGGDEDGDDHPPPWITHGHGSSSEYIEGVGTGQRRRQYSVRAAMTAMQHVSIHDRTPPPEFERQTLPPPPPLTPTTSEDSAQRAGLADPPPYVHLPVASASASGSSSAGPSRPHRTAAEEKEALAAAFAAAAGDTDAEDTSRTSTPTLTATPNAQEVESRPLSAHGLLLPPAYDPPAGREASGESAPQTTREANAGTDSDAAGEGPPRPRVHARRRPADDDELPVYQE